MAGHRTARDIMVSKLVTLSPDAHVLDGVRLLLKHRITGAPVVDENHRYLGVFSEKCCMGVLTLIARKAIYGDGVSVDAPQAREFMVTDLVTVSPETDVFAAIDHLLKNRISGAPVVDPQRHVLGVFSEKTSMRVLVDAAYEQVPSTQVSAFMNPDLKRIISEETDLLECAQIFIDTPYRRLPVLHDGRLVGQISRRDVLAHAHVVSADVKDSEEILIRQGHELDRSDGHSYVPARRIESTCVRDFMDVHAGTISEDTSLLSIAQVFLTTPYRRLPVLKDGQLAGQVSRRDVLQEIHRMLEVVPPRESGLLYLSSLLERSEAPI